MRCNDMWTQQHANPGYNDWVASGSCSSFEHWAERQPKESEHRQQPAESEPQQQLVKSERQDVDISIVQGGRKEEPINLTLSDEE